MTRKILKSPQAMIGLALIAITLLAAVFAPWIVPNNPDGVSLTQKFKAPSTVHPLGTDQLGRCEFSRLVYGARYSLGMALPILVILGVIGLTLGCACAGIGGVFDRVVTIISDIFIAFPALTVVAAIIGAWGNGIENIVLSIVISTWAWFTRMVRSYAVMEMGKEYILGARIAGAGTMCIIFRHVLPNIMPQYLIYASTGVASAILTVSGFSFLGLGLPAGTPEWGAMLSEARASLYSHPELLLYPGLCILATAAGYNLFGEALRDILHGGSTR